jgi:hypothetical protein
MNGLCQVCFSSNVQIQIHGGTPECNECYKENE